MFKNVIIIMTSMLILFFLVGCGVSKAKVTKIVKASLEKNFSSDPEFTEYNLKLRDLQVVKKDRKTYDCTAIVEFAGQTHNVPLQITVDGSRVEWDLGFGAFDFLRR